MNEEIIFKWDKVRIESLLEIVFKKVSRQKLKGIVHSPNCTKIQRDCWRSSKDTRFPLPYFLASTTAKYLYCKTLDFFSLIHKQLPSSKYSYFKTKRDSHILQGQTQNQMRSMVPWIIYIYIYIYICVCVCVCVCTRVCVCIYV